MKLKYLDIWKQFVVQRHLDRESRKQAKIMDNRQKRIDIEKEKKRRMKELGEKANKLRNEVLMKACFEVLKSCHGNKKALEKCVKYLKYRDK